MTTLDTSSKVQLKAEDFIKALTIQQRYDFFISHTNDLNLSYQENALNDWMNRKSILNEERYHEMFNCKRFQPIPFSNAVMEDLSLYKEQLKRIVEKEEWFKLLEEILNVKEAEEAEEEPYKPEVGYGYLIRPFIKYAERQLSASLKHIKYINETSYLEIYSHLGSNLLKKALKSFVLELNVSKLKGELEGDTPEKRFESFIKLKSKTDNLVDFYSEYAVLSRILVRETVQYINNVREMFNNLTTEMEEIKKLLSQSDLEIEHISFGEGDTHQEGKEVVIFTFNNNEKLVYKPKKLQVINAYNLLIDRLNQESTILQMHKIEALIRETYTLEIFIKQKPCNDLEEVSNYYKRFGQIVAVMHMINASDLHMENLIANGQYPCIVDLETVFQNIIPFDVPLNADVIGRHQLAGNVNSTLLLPEKIYHNEQGDMIEMSALSGEEQTLVKKGYKPKEINTDNMKYELDNLRIAASNNQVYLNGNIVDYRDFLTDIIEGFNNTMDFFLHNKNELLENGGIIDQFNNLQLRIILRSTYIYAQLLDNTLHPDYMRDYYYHEQILENLWGHLIKDKALIEAEYIDMMNGDIPIFFTKTSSTDIYDSKGNCFENILPESGMKRVRNKIAGLNKESISKQETIIKIKTGNFSELDKNKYSLTVPLQSYDQDIKDLLVAEATSIGEELASKAIIDDKSKTMTWITVNHDENTGKDIGTAEGDLYYGLAGVSLFYHYLFKTTRNPIHKKYRDYSLNMALKRAKFSKYNSGILGFASLIYPASIILKSEPNRKCKQIIQEATTFIESSLDTLNHIDWLHGKSSVIEMLLSAYNVYPDKEYIQLATSYGLEILRSEEISSLELGGLAHGYSGIGSTLLKIGTIVENQSIIEKANELLMLDRSLYNEKLNGWIDKRDKDAIVKHYWCHGTVGIGMSRLNILDILPGCELVNRDVDLSIQALNEVNCLTDDSLCHGNMGIADYYLELYQFKNEDRYHQKALQLGLNALNNKKKVGRYNISEFKGYPSVSLFRGLAGIGYTYLRLIEPKNVTSVLRLK